MSVAVSSYSLKEDQNEPKYPKAVFFIVVNEFCERFCYYGMKAVLSLYLHTKLNYDEKTSTVLFHSWASLCYFFPLFGGIVADTFLGKFRTIVILSLVYLSGNCMLAITAIDLLHLPQRALTMLGLLFIAVGTGGIKPCVSSFGGDQFILPAQTTQLEKFFSIFYFSINAGSLLSTFVTPIFRNDIKCFGQNQCFPLAFGVPALLMVVAIIVFLVGKPLYKMNTPKGNVLLQVCGCITRAIKNQWQLPKSQRTRNHWLDYADNKVDLQVIEDVKALLNVLLLFVPLPLFWALFDQQGSRWTFQATRMDGQIVGTSLSIKPDQMQLVNPFLILTFIPLFQTVLYPMIGKCGLNKPLRKLTIGGLLAALSFVVSAVIEFRIMALSENHLRAGHFTLRVYNSLDCDFDFYSSPNNKSVLRSMDLLALDNIPINGTEPFSVYFEPNSSCPYVLNRRFQGTISGAEGKISEYSLMSDSKQQAQLRRLGMYHKVRNIGSSPKMQLIYGSELQGKNVTFENSKGFHRMVNLPADSLHTEYIEDVPSGIYQVTSENNTLAEGMELGYNGVYVLNLHGIARDHTARLIEDPGTKKLHMLWLLPQYVILTAAEVMFSITGFEFAFTQAPLGMKSVISAAWLLTTAFGNLIVAIVAEAKIFENQAYEFLLFATMMVCTMGIFALLAMRYKVVIPQSEDSEESPDPNEEGLETNENITS